MLNYSVHALEQLYQLDPHNFLREDAQALKELFHFIDCGIKFELPTNGTIFDEHVEKGYEVVDYTMLNLPFPVTVLEYPFTIFQDNGTNVPSTKRIAVCLDYEKNKNTYLAKTALKICPKLEEVGGILLYPVFYIEGLWGPSIWGVTIPRLDPETSTLSIYQYGNPKSPVISKVGFLQTPLMIDSARRHMEKLGVTQAVTDALRDCGEEVSALIGLLAALSCSNVSFLEEPAPHKLNSKRIKNGKLPFYSYKVVSVIPARNKKTPSSDGTESGRQSPREHLRRGHIRRLSPGKNTWVQASVIGAATKGHIDKTYSVR